MILRTALLVLSGNAANAILSLARNLLVARLLPVSDYGIAATFAIALAVVEMVSALGLQQQIVQARDGNDPRFQAALQGFQLLRGVLAALALLLLARPMAELMRLPDLVWAFRLLALVPAINGLAHFDLHRLSRQLRFGPMLLTGNVPVAITLLAVWPLVQWLGDFRVMLVVILGQSLLETLTSHLVAERRYSLRLDAAVMRRGLAFGWPLLVNNALLFGVFQGDRVIVSRELGLEALAIFSMGLTLTLTPTLVLARSLQNIFLPQLSTLDPSEPRFDHLAAVVIEAVLLGGLMFVAAMVLAGAPVVQALLGPRYSGLLTLLTWLAILQALRVAKAAPAIIALSRGHTGNAMAGNVIRVLALVPAWQVAVSGGGLAEIIAIALGAELAGVALTLGLVYRRLPLRFGRVAAPLAASLATMALLAWLAVPGGQVQPTPWTALVLLAGLGGCIWIMRDLRRYVAG